MGHVFVRLGPSNVVPPRQASSNGQQLGGCDGSSFVVGLLRLLCIPCRTLQEVMTTVKQKTMILPTTHSGHPEEKERPKLPLH